jgi:NADH:ubiquinone oxidoreductase subunit H
MPLAPDLTILGHTRQLHLFGDADAGVFLALGLSWLSVAFLSMSGSHWRDRSSTVRWIAGSTLHRSLSMSLIVLGVFAVAGTMSPYARVNFQMSSLIGLQGRWNGMRWFAYLQPVALFLWLGCTLGLPRQPQVSTHLPASLLALNHDLLASALFLGGWQGPLVDQLPWLGIVYTAVKVALLAFLRTWIAASQPGSQVRGLDRQVWLWCTPLSILNLLVTVTIVALR